MGPRAAGASDSARFSNGWTRKLEVVPNPMDPHARIGPKPHRSDDTPTDLREHHGTSRHLWQHCTSTVTVSVTTNFWICQFSMIGPVKFAYQQLGGRQSHVCTACDSQKFPWIAAVLAAVSPCGDESACKYRSGGRFPAHAVTFASCRPTKDKSPPELAQVAGKASGKHAPSTGGCLLC